MYTYNARLNVEMQIRENICYVTVEENGGIFYIRNIYIRSIFAILSPYFNQCANFSLVNM